MATTTGKSITLSNTDVNFTLTGTVDYNIYGNNLTNRITGNDANNRIYGVDGHDSLTGGGGNDSLYGGDGNDTLVGSAGDDYMAGDYGNDSFVIDSTGDVVVEEANKGIDIVYTALVDYTLTSNVEYLTMTGSNSLIGHGNALDNRLIGNSGDNQLFGEDGNDAMYGGLGNDTIFGGDGNDVLSGQESENELHGGAGNDTYYISVGLDTIFENANEGTDTVVMQSSFTLPEHFENLTLTGTSNAIGRGNAARNTLIGNDGNNQLFGEDGNDSLDGRGGLNTLVGGKGDDIYTIRTLDDHIVENTGEGNDTVWIGQMYGDYTLSNTLENLRMAVKGNGHETMTGNNERNYISVDTVSYVYGLDGDDVISGTSAGQAYGGNGNDSIVLTGSGSYMWGGAGHDYLKIFNSTGVLYGNEGNDTLTAENSTGSHLLGGAGDDLYIIDAASMVSGSGYFYLAEKANEGIDTIKSEMSFTLTYSLTNGIYSEPAAEVQASVYGYAGDDYFENLTLTGTGNTNGFGNALNNNVFGNSGNNHLMGLDGHDFLVGYGGNDVLEGGNGNDTLMANGNQAAGVTLNQTGTIQMTGGAGNDTFWMVRGYVGDHSAGSSKLTITDFTHGVDHVQFSINTTSTAPTALNTLTAGTGDTLTSLINQAAAASASTSAPAVSSFVYSGNTYLVFDQSSDATFNAAADLAVKITGTPTLTFSDLSFLKLA
ncbi:hypothetical protein BXU06_10775 [Aquaspirillum sp. LM1]|nr:hypothetical protein BXU06_10775 [Aquaspirillum sp. LM1]